METCYLAPEGTEGNFLTPCEREVGCAAEAIALGYLRQGWSGAGLRVYRWVCALIA
jgi:hypothetical protein